MIGTGVFTSLGFQLIDIQSAPVIMMLWLVGGVSALCGALSYAELGAALRGLGAPDPLSLDDVAAAYSPERTEAVPGGVGIGWQAQPSQLSRPLH